MFAHFLLWLESTSPAVAISESSWLFPSIESLHVIAIALVVGSITMIDLRLLGFNLKERKVGELTREVLPWTWSAFCVAVITGGLLFSSNATHYWGTVPFRGKMLLLALAGVNMLLFHSTAYRSLALWEGDARPPRAARIAGGVSLALWIGVVTLGRWIGFV